MSDASFLTKNKLILCSIANNHPTDDIADILHTADPHRYHMCYVHISDTPDYVLEHNLLYSLTRII